MQLRIILAELGKSSVPALMPIPWIQNALSEDGAPAPRPADKIPGRVFSMPSNGTHAR
jgi:hypothetical protein